MEDRRGRTAHQADRLDQEASARPERSTQERSKLRTNTTAFAYATIAGLALTGLVTATADAAEIRVPEDIRSYRKALRKARSGDVVTLAPGN
jgi:hypothetical protein